LLHQAYRTRGARPTFHRQVQPDAHDLLVSPAESQVQETQRIKQRLRGVPERFQQDVQSDLGGAGTFSVATHAVRYHQQRGMLGDRHRDPILVFLPAPEKTQIRVFNLQGVFWLSGTLLAIL
jgi:hypothetical protein